MKHYVYSARTTDKGLAAIAKAKGKDGWDKFVNEAIAGHYGIPIETLMLPENPETAKRKADALAKKAEKATAKAQREKDAKAKKAKADKAKVDKAKADKAKKAKADKAKTDKAASTGDEASASNEPPTEGTN